MTLGGTSGPSTIVTSGLLLAHLTQKPERVMRRLVALAAPLGGHHARPVRGSGTTLVAAPAMGPRSIGIELSPETCRLIEPRSAQEALAFEDSR